MDPLIPPVWKSPDPPVAPERDPSPAPAPDSALAPVPAHPAAITGGPEGPASPEQPTREWPASPWAPPAWPPAHPYPTGQYPYGQPQYGYGYAPPGGGTPETAAGEPAAAAIPGQPYGRPASGDPANAGQQFGSSPQPYGAGPGYPYYPGPWGHVPEAPQPAPRRRSWTAAAVALSLLVAAVLGYGVASRVNSPSSGAIALPTTFPTNVVPPFDGNAGSTFGGGSSTAGPPSAQAAAVASKVDPGVVDINTVLGFQNGNAAGTGMVLSPSGEILTNNHVVEGATSILVTLVMTGRTYRASVVGTDVADDVAVIQLKGASGLTTVSTGDSSSLAQGTDVVAIGNAGGTGGTPSVAEGTVQALGQNITASDNVSQGSEQLTGLIQTTAPLQPGDSGGPLATTDGKVIGMDTAASASYQFQAASGQSFAIPINTALSIARQIESGRPSANVHIGMPGFLGVQVLKSPTVGNEGAVVQLVEPNTPAASAGLRQNDTITQVGGQAVTSASDLTRLLQAYHPGDNVTIQWVDVSGQSRSASVTLATGPVA